MAEGIKYKALIDKLSYVINVSQTSKSTPINEVAHFVCPEDYYYMDNLCHEHCGHKTINTSLEGNDHTI